MALTDAQKVFIRRSLGYNAAAESNYPWVPTFFSVTQVLDTLPAATETEVIAIIDRFTALEAQLDTAPKRLQASTVGSIRLNPGELTTLRSELYRGAQSWPACSACSWSIVT